jgi:hypothetical protein
MLRFLLIDYDETFTNNVPKSATPEILVFTARNPADKTFI